jgi:hypothetical protein
MLGAIKTSFGIFLSGVALDDAMVQPSNTFQLFSDPYHAPDLN